MRMKSFKHFFVWKYSLCNFDVNSRILQHSNTRPVVTNVQTFSYNYTIVYFNEFWVNFQNEPTINRSSLVLALEQHLSNGIFFSLKSFKKAKKEIISGLIKCCSRWSFDLTPLEDRYRCRLF